MRVREEQNAIYIFLLTVTVTLFIGNHLKSQIINLCNTYTLLEACLGNDIEISIEGSIDIVDIKSLNSLNLIDLLGRRVLLNLEFFYSLVLCRVELFIVCDTNEDSIYIIRTEVVGEERQRVN